MKTFLLVSLLGYAGLWLIGSLAFLWYFRLFRVELDLKHAAEMIRKVPAALSVVTVTVCSFLSFAVVSRVVIEETGGAPNLADLARLGLSALAVTVVLDLLITVVGERINILKYPINLIYLGAWIVIVPAVVLGGSWR